MCAESKSEHFRATRHAPRATRRGCALSVALPTARTSSAWRVPLNSLPAVEDSSAAFLYEFLLSSSILAGSSPKCP
jgi:hypothetical protein